MTAAQRECTSPPPTQVRGGHLSERNAGPGDAARMAEILSVAGGFAIATHERWLVVAGVGDRVRGATRTINVTMKTLPDRLVPVFATVAPAGSPYGDAPAEAVLGVLGEMPRAVLLEPGEHAAPGEQWLRMWTPSTHLVVATYDGSMRRMRQLRSLTFIDTVSGRLHLNEHCLVGAHRVGAFFWWTH